MPVGLPVSKDEHTPCDQSEREQGANVGKIGESPDVEQARWNTHHESRHPSGKIRCPKSRMHAPKNFGKEAIARHRKPHARLAQLENQQGRDHSHECADQHDQANSREMEFLQRVDHRGGIVHQRFPPDQTREHDHNGDVQNRADDQRRDDADRQIALRALALLSGRGDRIESDVGEKNDGPACQDSGPAIGREGMIVRRMDELGCETHEHQNGDDFQQHHDVIGSRRLFDASHQDHCQQHDDDECGPVKAKMPAGRIEHGSLQIIQSAGKIGRRNPTRVRMQAEPIEQAHHVRRKTHADSHVADRVFEDEIPANDPGDEFSHRCVRVGVRAARDGNHGGKLRVANRCETTDDRHQNERKRNGRPGARPSKRSGMVDQIFKQRGVQNRRGLKLLSRDRRADDRKNSGADDRADAERRQAQPSERLF